MYYQLWVVDKMEALGTTIENIFGLQRLLIRQTNHVINKVNWSDRSAYAALRSCSQNVVASIKGAFFSLLL